MAGRWAAMVLGPLLLTACAPSRVMLPVHEAARETPAAPRATFRAGPALGPIDSRAALAAAMAAATSGPLEVAFAGPRAATAEPVEISLVFSKPMRALGLPPGEPPSTVLLSPVLAGSWQWLGSSALRFNVPDELPAARRICAEVPAGTRALDGSTLGEAFRWCFETTRPALVGSEPRAGATGVAPTTPLVLAFNQPVAAEELSSRLRIVAAPLGPGGRPTGRRVAVGWTIAKDEGTKFELTASRGWPRSSQVDVRIDAGLRSTLGELPMGSPVDVTFETILPFTVAAIRCTPAAHDRAACDPREPAVVIETTTPVGEEALRSAIRIDPPVLDAEWSFAQIAPEGAETDADWYEHPRHFRLEASFEPGKRYRIEVGGRPADRTLRDEHGQPFAPPVTRTLRIADLPPTVSFNATGSYWPRSDPKKLPIGRVNVAEATVRALPLTLPEVLGLAVGSEPSELAARGRAKLEPGTRNQAAVTVVDVGALLGEPDPLGPVRVVAEVRRRAGQSRETERYDFQLTDLGLLTRADRERALVWVTSLGQGTPLAGVEVAVYGVVPGQSPPSKPIASATTDAQGIASVPIHLVSLPEGIEQDRSRPDAPRLLVVARAGRDWAHQEVAIAREPEPVGELFCERGIYRPGEEVALKGIVRLPGPERLEVPEGRVVRSRIEGPDGVAVASWTGHLSRFGTFSWRARLPADGSHGVYRAIAEAAGGILRERLYVVDYRPAESSAGADLDRGSYVRGDQALCTTKGEMLYGAPMAKAKASFVVERSRSSHYIPELYEWALEDETDTSRSYARTRVAQSVARLDGKGRAAFRLPLAFAEQTGPELVTCDVELEDHNRQTRSASTSAIVHPADAYAAIRRVSGAGPLPGDLFEPEVMVVTHAGQPIARAVRVEVLHRHRLADGTHEDRPVHACELTTGPAPVTCPAKVPTGPIAEDDAMLLRATTRDSRGNVAQAGTVTPILRERPRPEPPLVAERACAPRFDLHVTLDGVERPYDHTFAVGDHARVRLHSPFPEPALAIVTLERETVLWHRVVRLPGRSQTHPSTSALLDIPLTAAFAPNAELQVTAVAGARAASERLMLQVMPDDRVLDLTLRACDARAQAPRPYTARAAVHTPGAGPVHDAYACTERARFEPGEELDVALEVRDAAGRPVAAEITLWAADEGSLGLVFYRTPTPWQPLFEQRDPLVVGADARDEVVTTWLGARHRTRPPQVRMGATKVSGPERADFRQTVLFEPTLATDASGRLVHRVRLPDGLTSYRIMAVATTLDDRTGSAELNVTTTKPLMVRPTLPRVVRVGDELEASAVVTTHVLDSPSVRVELRAEGLVPMAATSRQVTLERSVPQELRFRLRAERAGAAALHFDATARDGANQALGSDAVVARAEVVAPTVVETAMIYGETRSAIAERLAALGGVRAEVGGLEVTLESSPLARLAEGMEQLLEYPYGCTEQLVSRLVPLVTLGDLAKALGVALPRKGRDPSATVTALLASQRADGGFGFWPGSGKSSPWLSSYALWGLGEATRRGVAVPADAHARARAYVAERLGETLVLANSPPLGPATPAGVPTRAARPSTTAAARPLSRAALAEAAFALDVLAADGHPDPARAALLAERHAELPPFAKALLLHALAAAGPVAPDAPLVRELESLVRLDGPVARVMAKERTEGVDGAAPSWEPLTMLLDSDLRTSAMTLRALASVDGHHRLLGPLALGLLTDRQHGRWRSTQEAAWALLALDAARRAAPPPDAPLDARLFFGPRLLAEASFDPAEPLRRTSSFVPMAALLSAPSAPLIFEAEGGGTLFYEARLRYARREPPAAADAGLYLTKTVRPLADVAQPPGPPLAGREITLEAGQVALCELVLVTPAPRFAVVIDDPLPGGLEPVDLSRREGGAWLADLESSPATRRELRDDRVLYFVDELAAGVSRFRYLVRATTPGRFLAPSSQAEEMYAPETFSRTAPGWVTVATP